MNRIIIFALVSIGLSVTYAYIKEEDFGEKLSNLAKEWHKKCDTIVGLLDTELSELKNGNFDIFDEKSTERIQRYITCLWIGSGVMSVNNEIDPDELQTYMPEVLKSNGTQIYGDCFEEVKASSTGPLHVIIWNAHKCIFKKDPENFIMF
ncbi:uncharacterized protein isoform X2 [Leptinotarsa decemlineata]